MSQPGRRWIVTTEDVLSEFLTFYSGRPETRRRAVAMVESLRRAENVRIVSQSHELFQSGFEFYASRPDKRYSLVACTSMEVMRHEGITDVLTTDHHFEQEGFRLLLHP